MSRRHPRRGEALKKVAETMAHFSRVARKPVWFNYDQLWDLESNVRRINGIRGAGKMTSHTFPSRHALGLFCAKSIHIQVKKIYEKINPSETRHPANMKNVRYYAYIHPGQEDMAGVHYNAGGENGA